MGNLLEISYEIDKLANLVDELNRLINVLHIQPSKDYSVTIKKHTIKAYDLLKAVDNENDIENYDYINELFLKYNKCIQDLPDDLVDKDLYRFKTKPNSSKIRSQQNFKRVRFHDNPVESDTIELEAQIFKPYKDDPSELEEQDRAKLFASPVIQKSHENSFLTNHDLFIQQQQQLIDQDSYLDHLSHSVYRNHGLSLDIGREINEQNAGVLYELENIVDATANNLNRVKSKLDVYWRSTAEQGPCILILVLTLILIFLVAVF